MDIHRDAYREEAKELLTALEIDLIALEHSPEDTELIARIFRIMHTLKGSGSMFGFDGVSEFTHELETVFDLARSRVIQVSPELISAALLARDQILTMIAADQDHDLLKSPEVQQIIHTLRTLFDKASIRTQAQDLPQTSSTATDTVPTLYWITFKPNPELFSFGVNPIPLLNELAMLGQTVIIPDIHDIPLLADMEPENCYTGWEIFLLGNQEVRAIREVFLFVEDISYLEINSLSGDIRPELKTELRKQAGLMSARGILSSEAINLFCDNPGSLFSILTTVTDKKLGKSEEAPVKVEGSLPGMIQPGADFRAGLSIRVASEKLDTLFNLVGEMVTVQARLNRTAYQSKNHELSAVAEIIGRLISELRDNTMHLRMLPIGAALNKFSRLVRDLSRDLNKDVILSVLGGETELDKTVLEKLHDPLIHIIRNSMDHGVELPERRKQQGKPPQGVITLSAFHSGTMVVIEISDDGAGIDPEVIRRKALYYGMPVESMTDQEVLSLIFSPGFSTVAKVTGVSGRGVGMDVVKRSIESLRGNVSVSSVKGQGTILRLQLPLTLAIIDGLLCRIGDGFFIIPISNVEECIELTGEKAARARYTNMIDLRGNILPFLDLHELFQMEQAPPEIESVIITEVEGSRAALKVDAVIGQHQTVLKSLGTCYRNIKNISGATILGDGTVALILDVTQLLKTAADNNVNDYMHHSAFKATNLYCSR